MDFLGKVNKDICEDKDMYEKKSIKPNLDLAGAPCFALFGFEPENFVSLITTSRIVGWAAHFQEQRVENPS